MRVRFTHGLAECGRFVSWFAECDEHRRCLSYYSWFDHPSYKTLGIPAIPPADMLAWVANATQTAVLRPWATYISLGSHDSVSGGDTPYATRLQRGFHSLARALGPTARVILGTTTARAGGDAYPTRLLHVSGSCYLTNLRGQRRNEAAANAFMEACTPEQKCKVVDLFSPSLPFIHLDQMVYKKGDPIHFKGHLLKNVKAWAGRLILDALRAM